jgi:hypothetical protein
VDELNAKTAPLRTELEKIVRKENVTEFEGTFFVTLKKDQIVTLAKRKDAYAIFPQDRMQMHGDR